MVPAAVAHAMKPTMLTARSFDSHAQQTSGTEDCAMHQETLAESPADQ